MALAARLGLECCRGFLCLGSDEFDGVLTVFRVVKGSMQLHKGSRGLEEGMTRLYMCLGLCNGCCKASKEQDNT